MKNTLSRRDFKVISEIFKAREPVLCKVAQSLVEKYYPKEKIIATKDFVYAAGDIPVGLVAHLDTVHKQAPHDIFHDQERHVLWSPQGLGADDRAGVYAIFSLLQAGYRPTVIFCTKEEIGGIGADELIHCIPTPLVPLNFLIELDRCGRDDMVFYDCENLEFEAYIESFGFQFQIGSFSDIAIIAPVWGIAAVNLSIGYESEHSFAERLYYNRMFETIGKVQDILDDQMSEPHSFPYIRARYGYGYPSEFDNEYPGHWDVEKGVWVDELKCDCCEKLFPRKQIKNIYEGGTYWYLCPDCVNKYARKCKKCGNYFIPWDPETSTEQYCTFCEVKESGK